MKMLAALLLVLGLAISHPQTSFAQEPTQETGLPMMTIITCDTIDKMTEVLAEKYKEVPVVEGTGTIFSQQGQIIDGKMTFWANIDKGTYSVTIDNGQLMCLVINGIKMAPAQKRGLKS